MKTLDEYNNIRALNQPYKCKLDDVFFFGKHKNKTINTVLSEELSYLKWCVLNINWFEMSEELRIKYNRLATKRGHFIYQDDYKMFVIGAIYPEIIFSTSDWFEESTNLKKRLLFFLDKKSDLFDDYDRKKIANVYNSYCKNKKYDHFEYLKKRPINNLRIQVIEDLRGYENFSNDYLESIFNSIEHEDYF